MANSDPRRRRTATRPSKANDDLERAKCIAREMQKILDAPGPRESAVARAAERLGKTSRHIYTLLERYRDERTASSLLRKSGPRPKRLSAKIEEIIATNLRERWNTLEAPDLSRVVSEIAAQCAEAGLPPPSYVTVQDRIPILFTPEQIAKKRSSNANDVRRLKPRPGYITAGGPLAVGQIDHTPTDIHFVEVVDATGAFVGRPNMTFDVDVFSKCILGFCLSLEKPSTLSIALCMAHSICKKDDWLKSRGITKQWPTYGRPKRVLVDSGPDFRGAAFDRGCAEYNIKIKFRNRGTVHTGGVVERLLGKINRYIGKNDGGAGRSVADRNGYPSENRACLTFDDLERCVALAIIDHNEEMNKRTLKVPIKEWKAHVANQSDFSDEPQAVLLNFLPQTQRVLTPQGLAMFALDYYSPWLGVFVPQRDRLDPLDVRWDPRDISHIYVRNPEDGNFRPVERRDGTKDSITLWQHQRDRRNKRAENTRTPIEKMAIPREIDEIVSAARKNKPKLTKMRKSEARALVRARHAAKAPKPYQSMKAPEQPTAPHPSRPKRVLPLDEW